MIKMFKFIIFYEFEYIGRFSNLHICTFSEASDYSEENTTDNEDFHSTALQPFQFEPEQKKTCSNERVKKHLMTLIDFVAVKLF